MTTPPAPQQATASPYRTRWFTFLVLVVGIGIGAAITGVVVTRGDDRVTVSSDASLSQVKSSCSDWMGSSPQGGTDDQWCSDMFTWMSDQSGGSMMGSMMWQGSKQMDTSCRAWVAQDPRESGQTDQQRCSDMVEWMDSHMSGRNGRWMMQDRSD